MATRLGPHLVGAIVVLLFGAACASPPNAVPTSAPREDFSGSASDGDRRPCCDGDATPSQDLEVHDGPVAAAATAHRHDPVRGHALTADGHDHTPRRLLRRDLRRGWCEPPLHSHVTASGTPYVHGFGTEPAFLGREAYLDLTRTGGETEIEAEVEWSLTRRIGFIAELPFIAADETGVGDAGLGLRALLVEERRFLLSSSTEVELPTGNERRGLGSGNVGLGSNLHTWVDLGCWVTLQAQVGVEYVPDEGSVDLAWSATLAKSFPAKPHLTTRSDGHDGFGPTAFSVLVEVQGHTTLSDDTGSAEGRWLLGAAYPLARNVELRGAYLRSFGSDDDAGAWTLGLIFRM